ncbi:hypothetical protein [Lederbergia ruris]|uniref:hypothetical protein n=1 Tax=Lederbergia ruris TaxID=217495 RepID=UPI0039A1016B
MEKDKRRRSTHHQAIALKMSIKKSGHKAPAFHSKYLMNDNFRSKTCQQPMASIRREAGSSFFH